MKVGLKTSDKKHLCKKYKTVDIYDFIQTMCLKHVIPYVLLIFTQHTQHPGGWGIKCCV